MSKLKRIALLGFVLISCVGCDQATKLIARQELASTPMREYGNGFFVRLLYAENQGAFLGLGAGLDPALRFWIFTVAVALLLVGLTCYILYYIQKMPPVIVVALALIAGGGIGNLIDRFMHDGRVVDFMQIGFYPLRTGVFNVADMAIMTGTGLILLFSWRSSDTHSAQTDALL